MRHAIRFEGGFEQNFAALSPGTGDRTENGARQAVIPWPAEADGLRFGFMEQRGKKFLAVRVGYGDEEVVLQHPVRLDPERHLGGRRFVARPIPIGDDSAGALFGDILDCNPEQQAELTALRARVRRDLAPAPAAPRAD
jgi:hypothetical protein